MSPFSHSAGLYFSIFSAFLLFLLCAWLTNTVPPAPALVISNADNNLVFDNYC